MLSETIVPRYRQKLQSRLKGKFQSVFEGCAKSGNPTHLNDIYTEIVIIEGGKGVVNEHEHESRQMETASRKASNPKKLLKCGDIFQPLPGRDHPPVRTVLMNGVAGIGKTILTKRFTLDWAEGKANHNIQFIFPFTFRELNLLSENEYSLVELIHLFFPRDQRCRNFQL